MTVSYQVPEGPRFPEISDPVFPPLTRADDLIFVRSVGTINAVVAEEGGGQTGSIGALILPRHTGGYDDNGHSLAGANRGGAPARRDCIVKSYVSSRILLVA